jgi:hypothetical protein
VEFKVDNRNPEMIGEYISALSNSATIWNKEKGYILWGFYPNEALLVWQTE